ncbi:MAG: type II secretion system protein [Eubacteriales bacterium]|nr:type II secretion system protein [Eubacteriales bacterium]
MKKLLNKKAFTLIEVLVAVCMIAVIALPLMSVFLQSVKTDQAAKGVLNANYISQDYIEKLDAVTYRDALINLPDHEQYGEYYLTATIEPYGTTSSSGPCEYVHLMFFGNETMLAVMPDGNWHFFSSIPNDVSLQVSGGIYTFIGSDVVITGETDYPNCALLINAMEKVSSSAMSVTVGTGCKAVLYCKVCHDDEFSFSGSSETYIDLITGDTSLVHVTAYVYDTPTGTQEIAVSESYINIANW